MTTRELFWKRALKEFRDSDAVDWAVEQLASSPVSPALATLAGLIAPPNGFEVEDLLRDALRELNLREPSEEEGYRDFVCANVAGILDGRISESEGCDRLAHSYKFDLPRGELQPFWLLQWAIKDLREHGDHHYDDRYTGDNLGALVREECEKLAREFCLSAKGGGLT
jgi:hypothetical protein